MTSTTRKPHVARPHQTMFSPGPKRHGRLWVGGVENGGGGAGKKCTQITRVGCSFYQDALFWPTDHGNESLQSSHTVKCCWGFLSVFRIELVRTDSERQGLQGSTIPHPAPFPRDEEETRKSLVQFIYLRRSGRASHTLGSAAPSYGRGRTMPGD